MKIEGLNVNLTCEAEPIQYEGTLDGLPVVFRARHGKWQFGVALDPAARIDDAYNVSTGALAGFQLTGKARIVFVKDADPIFTDCVHQFRASRVAA